MSAVRLGPVIRTIELVCSAGCGRMREQLVQARQQALAWHDRDVHRRQQRNQAGLPLAREHDQRAGVGQGVIGAGDADMRPSRKGRAVRRDP